MLQNYPNFKEHYDEYLESSGSISQKKGREFNQLHIMEKFAKQRVLQANALINAYHERAEKEIENDFVQPDKNE